MRVAVTGIGVVSALGADRPSFWESLTAGRSGIGPVDRVDLSEFRFQHAAQARDYDPADHFETKELRPLDRFSQLAVVAAREAVADAGVAWTDALRARTAVIAGSCTPGQDTLNDGYHRLYGEGRTRLDPLTIPRVMGNGGASAITMDLGFRGPSFAISSACSSATHAVGQALAMLRSGLVDVAVAGGSEAPLSPGNLRAWEALRVVSPDTCRPFSADRSGMVVGEGAAFLVLEPLEAARARGAVTYGEVAGVGMSADAGHLTSPSAEGAAAAVRAALADAEMDADEVGYVNAHGTGTPANDPMEADALRRVFGDRLARVPVSSTKSMHGHTLGAAGAVEAAATVLALRHGVLPPTANFTELDPACAPLDVVPNEAREVQVEAALCNSFAFGGLNAVLAFRRAER